jgi:hypothetical protein
MNPVELYILNKKEPYQSIMLYIREVIFKTLPSVEEKFRYSVPYYTHKNKPMLYLNILKGKKYVDIAFVQGVLLEPDFSQLKNDNNRKQVRSLQVYNLEDFDELMFVALLKNASELLDNSRRAWIL